MNLHIITIESLVNVNTIANTYHCEEHLMTELPPMYRQAGFNDERVR